ncbi:CgeB family protein [Acidisarcina polymorpha]|nr:glycosyltransferase [Acidisarcina polymorpha]
MSSLGHEITVFEPEHEWSIDNLALEQLGAESLTHFALTYPELNICTYPSGTSDATRETTLSACDIVVLHEWNPPALAHSLLELRDRLGFRLLFHDTHHRASSSPEQVKLFQIDRFDGVIAFGEALRSIYMQAFGLSRVWTLHEAADTRVFYPHAMPDKCLDVVWVGNWGDGERSTEISEFLLQPASRLGSKRFRVYGVRYPESGLRALQNAHVEYSGYLPNLSAPLVYARSLLTVHIPRQHYVKAMTGIPTIRVFEALACGIPLISAPWDDTEGLFRSHDFCSVKNGDEMTDALNAMLHDPESRRLMAERGLKTVLERHTCRHRASQLTEICEEVLA